MDSRTQERVEEWDSRPFDGGFDGLSDLAAADFSGAVTAVGTWLFMLNGRIIGVVDGDIEDFETASGTQYQAPHPSLPLLCAMEERGGETRANYYTNETPLREVDTTLQSGSFTGYIELSENVLSGDYYAVYYGGRRMAAAYIGNAERLLTGDEAFERAADEVGIYEVIDVDITVTDVPGTAGGAPGTDTDSGVDSSPDSGSSVGTGPGGSEPAVSGRDAAGTEPTADPTDAAIDPIDVSSTDPADSDPVEDVTVDDESALTSDIDLTGEHSGITAPDDDDGPEPEPASTGITESESAADPDPTLDADPGSIASGEEAESTVESPTEPADDGAGASGVDDSSALIDEPAVGDSPADESADFDVESATDGANDPASATTSSDEAGAEADTDTAGSDETTAGTDTELVSGSNPDFEEVKAAAEELERNDISWVDDEDEDDVTDEPADDAAPSSDDAAPEDEEGDLEEQFEREEAWRETRRIPSIDPDNSDSSDAADASASGPDERSSQSSPSTASAESVDSPPSGGAGTDSNAAGRTESTASSGTRETRSRTQSSQRNAERTQSGEPAAEQGHGQDQKRVAALSEKVETLQEQRDALVAKAEELEAERDRLRSENDELSSTVERLRSRIDELETELERARTGDTDATGTGTTAGTQLSPEQALSGTNLFVRYASKSRPTLETAHDGDADRSEVASNIQLEHHTQFDAADAAVDGTPYEDFLPSSMEHRFVDWLTEMLLYEIRDTGNADGLGDLYDAIPRIDRAEIGATISLEDDDTEDVPDQVTFDIVAYDKMGNPLVLVTLNDSREPATEGMLEQLEEAASAVKANYPDLAAAIAVTSSYFEPGALEVAEQATSGGLLSRGSKLSYVNLSRKEGYHLCLVESRSEGFHMNVPEL
ncbi:DUF7527 domain-containing protein [Natrinema salsiterrestre]|uniref:Transcriptional regulator n=1 Tax=Natrinema salsiterrestre TaxID=2950540 RepID=A0A9Q4L263_9EURY|nr:transcriptional regulator [Natrinema salsiterrestre]MDF9745152.1 transcriptional regulator [Natrinema salsiterrestre]